jgi:cytochrome c oxidase subunit III
MTFPLWFLYWAMTGLHALHVLIGVGLISVMAWLVRRKKFSPEYHTPVEVTGLYWHFVDIVWIFLYPLLYFIDRYS